MLGAWTIEAQVVVTTFTVGALTIWQLYAVALVAVSMLREGAERIHDLTASIESTLPVTETRVFAIYKINSRLADAGARRR